MSASRPGLQGTSGRQTVSACIITKNEEERLPAALASVAFCDEIVVVDSGSTDRTCALASAAGARVIHNDWPGFSAQRNFALDRATGEWVLEIDADERVTPELGAEIQAFLALPPPHDIDMAAMPLRERFLGRPLGPSVNFPAYKNRLFRRSAFRHDETRVVHEGLWPKGRVWTFDGELEHTLAGAWREAITDTWNYARLEATQVPPAKGAVDYAFRIAFRPVLKFVHRLAIDGGWRDGWRGWAKISLECLSDVAVWTRRLLGSGIPAQAHAAGAGVTTGSNRARLPLAPIRIVAVAGDPQSAERAVAWLAEARARGSEVGLVTNHPASAEALHVEVESVSSMTLLRILRALDYENHVRSVDALLVADEVSRRLVRQVPRLLKGVAGPFDLSDDPDDAERAVRDARRG